MKNVYAEAYRCLMERDPETKLRQVGALRERWRGRPGCFADTSARRRAGFTEQELELIEELAAGR